MSPEPEKRSDEEWGGWTAADFRRHIPRIIAERDKAEAALAASRAENERLRSENRRLDDALDAVCAEADRHQAERDAARVEVSQLRAEVEQLRKVAARAPRLYADNFHEFDPYERKKPDHPVGVFCKRCGNSEGNVYHDLDLRSVAEPLGSTPEQPAKDGGAA